MWTEKAKEPVLRLFRRGAGLKRVCRRLDLYVEQLKADVLAANLALPAHHLGRSPGAMSAR